MAITKFNGILYGGDYCPEQWDESVWQEDMRILEYYGVNTVTLNVFGWCVIQPVEGPYDFTKMDRIVKMLTDHKFNIIMATGTAALPMWLLNKYPEIMVQDITGVRNKPAKRVNYCPNSPDYLRETKRMCGELARHYKDQENIILWHLCNELEDKCYCENCAKAYRKWLQEKYGTLEKLNDCWNTMFWGHHYTAWEQINPSDYSNILYRNLDGTGMDLSAFPTETIEYLRFISASYERCFAIERDAIREFIPDALVTNNFQYRNFNYDVLARPLDVVSFDSYPPKDARAYETAFQYDLTRGINRLNPFLIMEMSPNQASWEVCAPVKRPGEVAQTAISAVARGAESALFFQVRRCRSGFEKFHGAMIEHSGRCDTRLGGELKALGDALKKLGSTVLGSKISAKAAVMMDWDSRWGVEIPSSIQKNMNYQQEVRYYYEWLHSQNIMTDIIRPGSSLAGYEVIIAPMMYMIEETEAENIKDYVRRGGTFITTYYSGMADKADNIWLGGYPGLLRDMLGLWVEETDALKPEEKNSIKVNASWLEGTYECGFLCDLIRVEGAEVLGTYGDDFYSGTPCITEHSYGKGKAVYIGTKPEKRLVAEILGHYCAEKGVKPVLQTEDGVEAVVREREDRQYLFLMNHNDGNAVVRLDGKYKNLLTDELQDSLELPVYGYAILEKQGQEDGSCRLTPETSGFQCEKETNNE